MAGESVPIRVPQWEAPLQSVPSPGGGHPPHGGEPEFPSSPSLAREALQNDPGLIGFVAGFLLAHEVHDWNLVSSYPGDTFGVWCYRCGTERLYRPDTARRRVMAFLDSLEGGDTHGKPQANDEADAS